MKKILSVILSVFVSTVLLCACSSETAVLKNSTSSSDISSEGKISVVATIFPPYDFTRQIGGENINVTMLLKPGIESHSYDPTPQDIIKIQNCDLFIYVGGESDEWVKDILNSNDKKPKKVIALMDCVDVVEEETVEGMDSGKEEHNDGDKVEYDEHVWTSPKNAVLITKKICSVLSEIDKSNAKLYEANTKEYCTKLSSLDSKFRNITDNAKRKTIVFGDRFPFRYFADEYSLKYYAAFPGCSSETEPSAATISFLINKVKSEKIPVVFSIELSNGKVSDTICESTGAKKLTFNSCHNITQKQFDSGVTYIDLMNENVNSLREALS